MRVSGAAGVTPFQLSVSRTLCSIELERGFFFLPLLSSEIFILDFGS